MSTPKAAAPAPANGEYSHRQILTILSGLLLGMFLAALDQTIVSTAIRTIADDLHGLSIQAWVTTAYLITSTITTPIYGKLGDLYGRKKLFIFAIGVFILGSAMCSFATSMYELAAFRAFQGIGAGGLMTLVLAIIGDLVPPRERAKYTGYFMATFGTSSVLGPVVGGFLAETNSFLGVTGWRWVFLVNVPIGIVAFFVVSATLHLPHVRREARIDWWGAAALVVALVPLLTVAEQGRGWGWTSSTSLICFAITVIGIAALIWIERAMGDDALIPLRIFRLRAASVTIVASVIVGIGMFGGITVLPLYMQIVHGASPMTSGLMMLPMVGGLMLAAIISGLITAKTGKIRGFPILGTLLATVGLVLLWLTVSADTSLAVVMAFMFVTGFGLGNCMQPLTLIVQNAVPPREIGVATAAATFFRQTGGTLGVAIFLSILFSTVGDKIKDALGAAVKADPSLASPANQKVLGKVAAQVQDDSNILQHVPANIAHPFKVGFADSMDLIFLCAAIVMFIGFLVLLLMPQVELRAQSASAAAASEASGGSAAARPEPVGVGAGIGAGRHEALGDEPADGVDESLPPRHTTD
ncbi:MAG TPA: MDR family MFS transporter [Flexivirga sp.]|uniref:MDR family MFS transporter n=1 Tax=Flexivirga sp. TaxID=1962927 RepID=UPI002C1922E8|nr:MDR family MFS transporter [Flexivirga sp.]HWC22109.1 MDR family MFS transporter [Flexivirga sp.]